MKIPHVAALLLSLILAATSAFGRELEDLKPGAAVESKAKPGASYRVQEVTPKGVWVLVPKRGGIIHGLKGEEGPSGSRRVFLHRDEVAGVSPIAPLTEADFSGEDGYRRLAEVLAADLGAADRAQDLDAAALVGPLREREALLRKKREETKDPALREVIDHHLRERAPMPEFVRRAVEKQLWKEGQEDASAATEKAWKLTLDAIFAGAKQDLAALENVREALQKKVIDDLGRRIVPDPAGAKERADRLHRLFKDHLEPGREGVLPKDMTAFLENLREVSWASASWIEDPISNGNPPLPEPYSPALPAPPEVAPVDIEELERKNARAKEAIDEALKPTAPAIPELPALSGGPAPVDPLESPLGPASRLAKNFDEALAAEPENVQAELLQAEAELLQGAANEPNPELNPKLIRVRTLLRDANRHLQRIAGEALESDPVAFAAELYRRGAAYERALRQLPAKLRGGYGRALKQIGGLLNRAREAARATATPLTPLEGARQLRALRVKRAEAIAQGLKGLANQLRREEAEVQRRIQK